MFQQARGPTAGARVQERWAHLRFSVIGQLLAAPPAKGELKAALMALAARTWQHPTTSDPVHFGFATIERWYYRALKERVDPVGVLRRKLRADAGQQVAIGDAVRQAVLAQYAAHKSWSVQLHHDNLVAPAETKPELKPVPSYATLRRFMSANGLAKRRRVTSRRTNGAERAEARIADREVRCYEAEYVNGLWHWDCHHGSRKVLTQRGEWVTPILFGVLDDRSRLACHLQWYLAETAEVIAHGLSQAFQKRGLPRAALSDNGAAMTAAEITEGLTRLGVLHHTTLPYSPYQNAKQEAFWGPVEGRLIAMLEHVPDLTLSFLNEATLPTAMRCASPSRAALIAPTRRATAPSSSRVAASRCRTVIGISTASRSATPVGISASSISSTSVPATCSRVSIRRTRRRTPVACAGRSIRSPLLRPPPSRPRQRRRPPSRPCSRGCSIGRPVPVCRRPICRRTKKETTREQEDAGPPWPQVEPVRSRRAGRGAPRQPAHRVVLLARRATRRRGRLRPRHRRARHRQVGHAAHSRRAARRTARRQDRHRQPAPGRPRRLLPRDGRPVRRRTGPAQTIGPRQGAARGSPHR